MEDSNSERKYEGTSKQIGELSDAYSSDLSSHDDSKSDDNKDQSYDSDKAAELLTSKFGFSRSSNDEENYLQMMILTATMMIVIHNGGCRNSSGNGSGYANREKQ